MKRSTAFTASSVISTLAIAALLAGCALNPSDIKSSRCGDQDYDCNVTAEAVQFVREEKFLDCSGKLTKTEMNEYDGSKSMLKVPSVKNIPMEKGEFVNATNGSTAGNQRVGDGAWPVQHYDVQYVFVSGAKISESLKLEKGVNVIKYKYMTCEKTDAHGDCGKWAVQEEGDRTVLALYSKVLNKTCVRKAKCKDEAIEDYEACSEEKDIPPRVLEMDYGKDIVK